MSFFDRLTKSGNKLISDTAKNAPSKDTTQHVWCSAFVVGASKCPCPKHCGAPVAPEAKKEEKKDGTEE